MRVGAPDEGGVVDGVRRHGEDRRRGEVVGKDGYAGPGRDEAGEAEGGGGVDAESFVDDVVKAERRKKTINFRVSEGGGMVAY